MCVQCFSFSLCLLSFIFICLHLFTCTFGDLRLTSGDFPSCCTLYTLRWISQNPELTIAASMANQFVLVFPCFYQIEVGWICMWSVMSTRLFHGFWGSEYKCLCPKCFTHLGLCLTLFSSSVLLLPVCQGVNIFFDLMILPP